MVGTVGSSGNASDTPTGEVRITSAVDPAVTEGANIKSFEVKALVYKLSKKGPYLKAKGGRWMKWGLNAFHEVIPQDVDYGSWQVDVDTTNVPPQMRYAYYDEDKKQVVAFATTS